MKAFIFSCITLGLVTTFVFLNSFIIFRSVTDLSNRIDAVEPTYRNESSFIEIYEDYKGMEKYFSITVSHSDLTSIEDSFAELLGAAEAKDDESLTIAKSRLKMAFNHLKRLSGVNFDSIF